MTLETTYSIPEDRHYDRETHMWAKVDPASNRIVVGIDTLGLSSLGDLAYISLEAFGSSVTRGQPMGAVEAAKMTGDIIAPVTGSLVDRNENVLQDPSMVNNDPYESGWLAVIEPANWNADSAKLVSGSAIPEWVAAEIVRYRAQGWID